jgi:hypothetical protein
MTTENEEKPAGRAGLPSDAPRLTRRSRPTGRPPIHGLKTLRRAVTRLTTRRLDGRSAVAVAVRRWKEDVTRDLGGDLTRAQETILETAAQRWVVIQSLYQWIGAQPSLVTKKRRLLDVVMQTAQLEEGLARMLDRLGLDRKARPVPTLAEYLAQRETAPPPAPTTPPAPGTTVAGSADRRGPGTP